MGKEVRTELNPSHKGYYSSLVPIRKKLIALTPSIYPFLEHYNQIEK
jgi:hypothetical protein